ncbi:helix-turn-helix domain-containing protein [Xanthomarina gelatinilytica]|uniref:helix-turn-helix domain-containing protein n=1 Tax=Xanthomarina gelatinilytica TaxID=1137281 RepID=UPI003AA973D8
MPANLITTDDLREFKIELLEEFKKIINSSNNYENKKYLKSAEIRKLLKVSPGTLQTLRINGTLPYIKIGGIILYDVVQINKVLEANKIHNV